MSVSYSLMLLCSNANPYKIDTDKMPAPSFMAVIIGVGQYAYKRKDGVYVIPIGCLKDWPPYREVPDWLKNHRSLFVFEHCLYFLSNAGACANASAPRAFVSAPVCVCGSFHVRWQIRTKRERGVDGRVCVTFEMFPDFITFLPH